jgi:CPA2 family monovalent cation:H+ antiporter-2
VFLVVVGRASELEKAAAFLESDTVAPGHGGDFDRAVLESFVVPEQGPVRRPLGELQIARRTGVRVLGIARNDTRILVPQATETLRPGDRLLGLGTLDQLRDFRAWLTAESHPT